MQICNSDNTAVCNIQSPGHRVWYTSKPSCAVLSAIQRVPSSTRMSWDLGGVMKKQCVRNCEYTASISLCWLLCVSIHRSPQEKDQSPGWEMRWVFVVQDNTKSFCIQVDAKKNRGEKNASYRSASLYAHSGGRADHISIGHFVWSFLCLQDFKTQMPPADLSKDCFH